MGTRSLAHRTQRTEQSNPNFITMKILIAVAMFAAVFVLVVQLRPSEFRIARSTSIIAPPALSFEQVNNLHKWQEMSPYAKLDPNAQYTFAGPAEGKGASMSWRGNRQVGEGQITIVESRPNELVRMKLEFVKPFKVTNSAEFTFSQQPDGTKVTWAMFGRSRFLCKAIGLFVNMDKICGSQFEEGLANMKTIAERQTAQLAVAH
jgi:hypothetical protein